MGRRHQCNDCMTRNQASVIPQRRSTSMGRSSRSTSARPNERKRQKYDSDNASTFMNTDPRVLVTLPESVQDLFPAYLTNNAAVTEDLLMDIRAGASERASFAPRRKLMVEKRSRAVDKLQKTYFATCLRLQKRGATVTFPHFKLVSSGLKKLFVYVPTAKYLKDVYISSHFSSHRMYQDAYHKTIFGAYWAVDHSFKVTKRITMNGEVLYLCLFTITNEFGQILKQALCTSKGRDELRSMILELRER